MKKGIKKEDNIKLDFAEQASLRDIQNSREALQELEKAIFPLAQKVARDQRAWWNRILGDRGLEREDGSYSIDLTDISTIKFEPYKEVKDGTNSISKEAKTKETRAGKGK